MRGRCEAAALGQQDRDRVVTHIGRDEILSAPIDIAAHHRDRLGAGRIDELIPERTTAEVFENGHFVVTVVDGDQFEGVAPRHVGQGRTPAVEVEVVVVDVPVPVGVVGRAATRVRHARAAVASIELNEIHSGRLAVAGQVPAEGDELTGREARRSVVGQDRQADVIDLAEDQVHIAVAVRIGGPNAMGSVSERVVRGGAEDAGSVVEQDRAIRRIAIADRDVVIAVAVEVGHGHGGRPRARRVGNGGGERTVAVVLVHRHMVGISIGHHQIDVPVAVHIGGREVHRPRTGTHAIAHFSGKGRAAVVEQHRNVVRPLID